MTCPLCHLPAALCDIERFLYRNLCCKTFGGHTKYLDLWLQWVRWNDAAVAQAEDGGDLWAREEGAAGKSEGAAGKSKGANVIRETKLPGLSQQGFLLI